MKHKIPKGFLMLLGFFLLILFIWFRFIREQLPRDIPFTLDLLKFIGLFATCSMLFIILLKIISIYYFPLPVGEQAFNIFSFLTKPLEILDQSIKNHDSIKPHYIKVFVFLLAKIKLYYKSLISLEITLRMTILFTFLMDVFIFHKFSYFYKAIYLFIPIYIIQYLFYCLNTMITDYKSYLDNRIEIRVPTILSPIISIDCLIDEQTNAILEGKEPLPICMLLKHNFIVILLKKLNLSSGWTINNRLLHERHRGNINFMVDINITLRHIESYKNDFHYVKIVNLTLYLIGWYYILVISFYSLNLLEIVEFLLPTLKILEEPFSGVLLIHDLNEK